tara:strand:+ start:195 stop:1169 length:975 start_codon:yes stop_codon:yes gene_type:complete
MALRVVNTRVVLQELRNPSAKSKSTYRMNHHRRFTFKNVKNNIIRSVFFAEGVSESQFVSNVQAFEKLLSQSTNVTLEKTDPTTHLMKIKKKPDTGYVLIYFNYVAGSLSDTINEGQLYERQMITKLNSAGYTQQKEPDTGLGDPDVIINAKGVTVGVELKEKPGAAFGSATLEYGNGWKLKYSTKQNPAIPSIVSSSNLLREVNDKWNLSKKGLTSSDVSRATKELQGILGEVRVPIDASAIREYYSKCDYIQIKGKGLYKVKSDDPLNCNANLFSPTDSYIRVRVQYKSSSYRFALELYMGKIVVSSVRLGLDDPNFSFLKE